MSKILLFILIISITTASIYVMRKDSTNLPQTPQVQSENLITQVQKVFVSPPPSKIPVNVPKSKTITNNYHIFQTFNNCGPAALSMALSYYGINKSQAELGNDLRPYQIPGGDNDDKSVTLEELAEKSKEFDLIPYLRPGGDAEIIKEFIASDIPVITRTWLKEKDDIGHYRIIKGYDDNTGEFIQDDSLQGKSLRYTYEDFDKIWDKFNYEYLVLIPKEKQQPAEQILGEDLNEVTAWLKAVNLSETKLNENPDDITARFNLSVAYYKLGDYEKSVAEFEKVENKLPFRTLWYQIDPILAYYELGNYERVRDISDKILANHNRAFSELYLLKGNIHLKRGDKIAARREFEKAVNYNRNLKPAREAVNLLGNGL